MKVCITCHKDKRLSSFRYDVRYDDEYQGECITCYNKKRKALRRLIPKLCKSCGQEIKRCDYKIYCQECRKNISVQNSRESQKRYYKGHKIEEGIRKKKWYLRKKLINKKTIWKNP